MLLISSLYLTCNVKEDCHIYINSNLGQQIEGQRKEQCNSLSPVTNAQLYSKVR